MDRGLPENDDGNITILPILNLLFSHFFNE